MFGDVVTFVRNKDLPTATRVFVFSPTWSRVCEKHATSIILLYTTEIIHIVMLLTDTRSLMPPTIKLGWTESSVEITVMSCLASSSPVRDLANNINLHTRCLIFQSLMKQTTTTNALHTCGSIKYDG